MKNETYKPKSTLCQDIGSRSPSLAVFDLPILIAKMKKQQHWTNCGLNSMILLKTPDKQIVLTTLQEGTEIDSFQSNNSITFHIIEGKLIFHTRKESVIIDKGQLLTLHENIKYSLSADEDTVLIMTIANGGLQLSVN